MAIDHRILQQIGTRSNAPVLDIFNSIIQDQKDAPFRQQRLEQGQAKTDLLNFQTEQAMSPEAQLVGQQQQAQQIAQGYASSLQPLLGNPPALLAQLQQNKQRLTKLGIPTTGVDEDILQAQTPKGLALLAQEVNDTLVPAQQRQRVTASKILDDGTTIQSLSTGGTNVVSAQGEVLTGEARKAALDNALKSKVVQKGNIAQTISDVRVDEAIRLEKETVSGKQSIESKQINIDETKIKNAERKKQAIDSKNSRRAEADNASLVVSELLDGDAFSDAFGRFNNAPSEGLRTQANIDARSKVDQVVGLLSLESRQKLKGQGTITDSEAKTLEKSATVLTNPLISDNVARKELRRVKRIFEDASDRNQLKQEAKEQSEQQAQQQQSQVLNFDAQGNLIQ